MEKEPESIATVQMKPEYAASEVYSTTSEAPPAYKMRQSNSVQIAKIVAITVVLSSFIIGCFVLASAYLQAKASCDQMQTLDSVLEKELMLETLQDLPKAEALQARDTVNNNIDNNIQNLEKEADKKNAKPVNADSTTDAPSDTDSDTDSDSDSDSDSSYSDSNESGDMNRVHIKLPLELDLSDLANALLENNQKSRMNCVVERRRSEEYVDSPAKTMQLPFGLNISTDPKKQKITGERMAIFCSSGSEENNEDAEPIKQIIMPMHAFPMNFGPQMPITHMPQQMPPQQPQQNPFIRPIPPQPMMYQMPQQPMPPMMQSRPPVPDQIMQAPRPEQQEVRIHLQRIPIPEALRNMIPIQESNESPQQVEIQRVPLGIALQRAGITADDLRNIQRMAEERIQQELRDLNSDETSSNSEDDESDSSEENDSKIQIQQALPQFLQMGRLPYGRSLITPVKIPVPMMQTINQEQAPEESHQEPERPHYVQPRSVRSVDSVLHREKRIKRCACDCNC